MTRLLLALLLFASTAHAANPCPAPFETSRGSREGQLCSEQMACCPQWPDCVNHHCAVASGTTAPPTTTPTTKPPATPSTVSTTTPTVPSGPCMSEGDLCSEEPGRQCCQPPRAPYRLRCPKPGEETGRHCRKDTTIPTTTPTTVPAGTPTTTLPKPVTSTTLPGVFSAIRPTAQDVSINVQAGAYYTRYRGEVATQPVRDAMQQAVVGVFIPKALRYARTNPACQSAINFALSGQGNLDKINAKLGNLYENLASPWSVPPQGRNYSFDWQILKRIQTCSLADAVACATNALMTIEMRDLLDLHVAGGRCVRGGTFLVFPESGPFKGQLAALAPVNKHLGFAPTGTLLTLLRTAVGAHGAASDCSGNFAPIGGGVDQALRAYESAMAAAGTTTEDKLNRLHFAQLKRFDGYCDSQPNGNPNGWTNAECCRWKALQHRFMMTWEQRQIAGDWQGSRNADSDHFLAHICANLKNDEMDVRFSFACPNDPHDCPISNCKDALARLLP